MLLASEIHGGVIAIIAHEMAYLVCAYVWGFKDLPFFSVLLVSIASLLSLCMT